MSPRLDWTRTAVSNLDQIHSYLSSAAGEEIARMVEGNIHDRVEELSEFPKQGRIVPELFRSDIREVFVRSFRIIYRIEPEDSPELISILGVAHPSQLLENTGIFDILN